MSNARKSQTSDGKMGAPIPRRAKIEVEFVFEHPGAEQVYICGDFNGWQPWSLPMIGNPDSGSWAKRLALEPGRYEYKFVADGNWIHDPVAPGNVPNRYGTLNSVVEVGPEK
jgi:1,4-alpha-glucan branching enzyme